MEPDATAISSLCDSHHRLIDHIPGIVDCTGPNYSGLTESLSPPPLNHKAPPAPKNRPCGLHTRAIRSAQASHTVTVNIDFSWSGSRGTDVIITSKSDYGLRAALYLAASKKRARLRDISQAQHIPESVCAQIMRKLVAARIVASQAGPAGGYTLAQRPEDISVARILTASDRDICIFRCVEGDPETGEPGCDCHLSGECAFQGVLQTFAKSMADYLERLSLADLHEGKNQLPEFALHAAANGKAS